MVEGNVFISKGSFPREQVLYANRSRSESGSSESSREGGSTNGKPRRRSHRPRGCRGGSNRRRNANSDSKSKHRQNQQGNATGYAAAVEQRQPSHAKEFSSSRRLASNPRADHSQKTAPSTSLMSLNSANTTFGNGILPPLPVATVPKEPIFTGPNPYALKNQSIAPSVPSLHPYDIENTTRENGTFTLPFHHQQSQQQHHQQQQSQLMQRDLHPTTYQQPSGSLFPAPPPFSDGVASSTLPRSTTLENQLDASTGLAQSSLGSISKRSAATSLLSSDAELFVSTVNLGLFSNDTSSAPNHGQDAYVLERLEKQRTSGTGIPGGGGGSLFVTSPRSFLMGLSASKSSNSSGSLSSGSSSKMRSKKSKPSSTAAATFAKKTFHHTRH